MLPSHSDWKSRYRNCKTGSRNFNCFQLFLTKSRDLYESVLVLVTSKQPLNKKLISCLNNFIAPCDPSYIYFWFLHFIIRLHRSFLKETNILIIKATAKLNKIKYVYFFVKLALRNLKIPQSQTLKAWNGPCDNVVSSFKACYRSFNGGSRGWKCSKIDRFRGLRESPLKWL
jgi:hypothetical protein